MAFREELRRLRESIRVSAAALDERIKRRNYVNRLEAPNGLPAPAFEVVVQIGDALRELGADTSGDRLWRVAQEEVIGPALHAHWQRQLEQAVAASDATEEERRLLASLRSLGVPNEAIGRLASRVESEAPRFRAKLPPSAALGLVLVNEGVRLANGDDEGLDDEELDRKADALRRRHP